MAKVFWKCDGTIEKYQRPCPQKFFFYDDEKISLETLKESLQIKCPRCGALAGGIGWS